MSWIGKNTQVLARCGGSWVNQVSPMAGRRTSVPLSLRHVSTTKSKKAQAVKETPAGAVSATAKEKKPKPAPVKKTAATTKTAKKAAAVPESAATKLAAAAKGKPSTLKEGATMKTSKTKPTTAKEDLPKSKPHEKKSAPTKPTIAKKTLSTLKEELTLLKERVAVEATPAKPTRAPSSTSQVTSPKHTVTRTIPAAPASKTPVTSSLPHVSTPGPRAAPGAPPPTRPLPASERDWEVPNVDRKSPEFKKASRRYISVMVALPILFVTSYFLFDRLALGNKPDMSRIRPTPASEPVQAPVLAVVSDHDLTSKPLAVENEGAVEGEKAEAEAKVAKT